MNERLGDMELRFAEMIWNLAPVGSGELVRRCAEQFQWKKSTTYTMLKRLCDKGIFSNCQGEVRALVSREQYSAQLGRQVVQQGFGGSLPRFVAAFAAEGGLSRQDVEELQRLIDESRGAEM